MAKIGEGHAAAMGRLGLKELRNAVNPSREGVADTEIGLYGTQTQGEIAEARGGAGKGPEQEGKGQEVNGPEQGAKGNEQEGKGKVSLADLRQHAADRAKEADMHMEKGHGKEKEQEGPEMEM